MFGKLAQSSGNISNSKFGRNFQLPESYIFVALMIKMLLDQVVIQGEFGQAGDIVEIELLFDAAIVSVD